MSQTNHKEILYLNYIYKLPNNIIFNLMYNNT